MQRLLLSALALVLCAWSATAQTTILDFETAATSTVFEYFGNGSVSGLTSVIENPDKSGANTSDSVTVFHRGVAADAFAGCFSNPNPTTAVDLTNGDFIYLKVWMPATGPGLVRLKLEQGTTGDWEQEVEVPAREQWVEVIFNPNANFGASTAAGNSFDRVVVFFDFGTTGAIDSTTYYFDDLVVKPAPMNVPASTILDFEAMATTGDFQYFGNGSADGGFSTVIANPDASGINVSDSVCEFVRGVGAADFAGGFLNVTQPVDLRVANTVHKIFIKVWVPNSGPGTLKFKLEDGPGNDWEQDIVVPAREQWVELEIDPTIDNNGTVPVGKSYGRAVLFFDFGVTGATDSTIYYLDDLQIRDPNAVVADSVDITFNVNMRTQDSIASSGVYIAGGGNFGVPGDFAMLDPDGDSTFTITVRQPVGFSSFYTFTNGACGDFSCKENLTGKPCGDPNNFNDRSFPPVMADTVISTCFGECTTDGSCPPPVTDSVNVTFELNMGAQDSIASTGVYIAGGGTFGNPGDNPMDDSDGDSVYTITFRFPMGTASFYTFTNGACGDYSCKEDIAGQPCAQENNFNDRFFPALMSDTTISTCFAECTDDLMCGATGILTPQINKELFTLVPSVTGDVTNVIFGNEVFGTKQIEVIASNGQRVMAQQVSANQNEVTLNVNELVEGIYFVRVVANGQASFQKMMIAR